MQTTLHQIDINTDASGDATGYSDVPVTGRILQMRYVPDGSVPLATGADITVTGVSTGAAILVQANIGTAAYQKAPRQPTHGSDDGAATLYAAGGEPVEDYVFLANEKIKIVVAQGGNAKQGKFYFWVG